MTSITVTTSESEFQNIRMDNKYYVDKSLLIKDILSDGVSGSYLFIRPRRFGKSMNLSMLDAFFNIKYKGNDWFDGLEISEYKEYERYKNNYPVIRLDFGDVYAESWDDFLSDVGSAISEAYVDNSDLINDHTSPLFLETYQRITRGDYDDRILKTSLGLLALELRTQYGNRAVVLIDEYDAPLTRSIGKEVSTRVTGFLSNLYSDILKGKKNVQMSYVTGTSRVMHQGFFSGLNNMIVDDAFSTMSGERFGFTEPEVRELLGYYGASDKFEEVREWYDGYRFGNVDVYNPFSVMSYIRRGFIPSDYWIGTSSDSILRWVL
ncbi:MAG: AAA family ATPase, partial [Candidatus Methanomethylophilaceae archaeon]